MKLQGLIVSDDVRDWAADQEIALPDDDGLDVMLALHEREIIEAMEYAGLEAIRRLLGADRLRAECHDYDLDGNPVRKTAYVVVDYEPYPEFDFLEQDCFAGEDPADHIQLDMVAYDEAGNRLDSLSCIDFLRSSDDWSTGTFHRLSDLKGCEHLQEVAREMGLAE